MNKKTFTALVHDGDKFTFDSPEAWKENLKQFNDTEVYITIGKWYAKMSDRQRKYYFGVVIKELVNFTGFEKDELHDYCKAKFNSETVSFEKLDKKDGEEPVKITRIKSITVLSTIEMEEYMEKIRNWAGAFLGVYIPLPNELEGTEYGEFYYDLGKEPK